MNKFTLDTLSVTLLAASVSGSAGWAAGRKAWLLLGRLRRGARVPPGWCEAGIAALWAAVGVGWAAGALPVEWVPVLLGLSWLAVVAGAVDVLHHRLPDALTLPSLPVVLLLLLPVGPGAALAGAAGAVIAVAGHAAVHMIDRRAVGAGDVKLAATLGAVLAAVSWPALAAAAVLAAVLTALVAAVGLATGRLARGAALPHGPSMLAATWLIAAGGVALGAP